MLAGYQEPVRGRRRGRGFGAAAGAHPLVRAGPRARGPTGTRPTSVPTSPRRATWRGAIVALRAGDAARSGQPPASSPRSCAPSSRCHGRPSWRSPRFRPTTGGAGRCSSRCGRRASRTCAGWADEPGSRYERPARTALARLPVPPTGRLELGLLGSVELRRDGRPVDAPEWRRRRVRDLLSHLVLRRPDAREQLAADLWPELDAEGQARNLRVTLTHLLRALEPDRRGRDASFLVQTHGDAPDRAPGRVVRHRPVALRRARAGGARRRPTGRALGRPRADGRGGGAVAG